MRRRAARARGRVSDLIDRRPFSLMLLVVVAVAVPGYWRLEQAVDEAHKAATDAETAVEDLAALVQAEEAEEAVEALVACRQRNDAFVAIREGLNRFVDGLVRVVGPDDPDVLAAAAVLRETGIADADATDRDCDADGVIDPGNYGS